MESDRIERQYNDSKELYAYLELGDTWEESFLMEFRITEVAPHYIKKA